MNEQNEITTEDKLFTVFDNNSSKSVFLGNGFNLCLGVNTSYKSLFESILSSRNIKKIIKKSVRKNIEGDNFNLEAHIEEIPQEHRDTVMEKFYDVILKKCRKRIYRYKEVIRFFLKFDNFFTINYDPLLYRFLLNFKVNTASVESDLYRDLESIHAGIITEMEGFDDIPLRNKTKKSVYEIARYIFKEENKHKDYKREEYYDILKELRNEPRIEINDGFVINQPTQSKNKRISYKTWKNGKNNQNIFYLHGALHIYKSEDRVRKLVMKKGFRDQSFINVILEEAQNKNHSCIFDQQLEDKVRKIKDNSYLKHCFEQLSKAQGELFLIGWSCSDNDDHLVRQICKSNINKLYISYHDLSSKERFRAKFNSKEITFFNSKLLPFSKKGIRM